MQSRNRSTLLDLEKRKTEAEIASLTSDAQVKQANESMLNQFLSGGGSGGNGGAYVDSLNVGGLNIKVPPTQAQLDQQINQKVQETKALETAKGVDKTQAGKYANITEALGHRQELMDILYPKDAQGNYDTTRFNPEIKPSLTHGSILINPLSGQGQRLKDILGAIDTAHRLTLTTRGVNGEITTAKGKSPGGLNILTNPSAYAKQLDDFFKVAEETVKNINPEFKNSGNTVDYKSKYGLK